MGIYVENGISVFRSFQVFTKGSKTQAENVHWVMAGQSDKIESVNMVIRNCATNKYRVYDVRMYVDGPQAGLSYGEDVTEQFPLGL